MGYNPEELTVYRLARRHTRVIAELLKIADTRGYGDEVDNLRRATTSVPSNIKEGYGDFRPRKKAYYYQIAKASVTEAWGHLDNLVDLGCIDPGAIAEARGLQNQMIALLITMIRNLESRPDF